MKNIFQRIVEVQKACAYVKKDTEVGFGNNKYKAVSHDGVLAVVRQSMIDNGIAVIPSQKDKGVSIDGTTKSGTAKIRFEAVYDISFINVDDPNDKYTMSVEAHGEDANDKAPGKAISYATKTAMLKTFLLATGENDEARMEESFAGRPFTDDGKTREEIERELKSCTTTKGLLDVYKDNDKYVDRLTPNDIEKLRKTYKELQDKLKPKAANE